MASTTAENNNTMEGQFSEQQQQHDESYDGGDHLNGGEDDSALTLRALVSTKEAGVIIGKGKTISSNKEGRDDELIRFISIRWQKCSRNERKYRSESRC